MRKLLASILLLALTALPVAVSPHSPLSTHLAFTHVPIIDATGAEAKPDSTVVVTGKRITELGKASRCASRKGHR